MEDMDPIAQQLIDDARESGLLEDGNAEYDEAYGLGKWPLATLTDVVTYPGTDYGFRLGLKLNLKGDEMAFTGRFDLPRTLASNGHEVEAWQTKKETDKLAVLNRGVAAVGYANIIVKTNIDNETMYEQIAGLFRAKIGSLCPVHVKADGKNSKDDAGKWTFTANGYTKLDFLRRPKGK